MRSPSDAMARRDALLYEPIWLESNEQKEAARALEMLHVQLISAVIDPYAWKWVILTLHHTVDAFLVASLSVPDEVESQEAQERGPALRVYPHHAPGASSSPRGLLEAYARMKRATGFKPSEDVDEAMARLEAYRDALFGEIPQRWTLRVNELPRLTHNCLRVVEHLGWNPGHIGWRKENLTDLARVKFLASIKVLEALASQYRTAA